MRIRRKSPFFIAAVLIVALAGYIERTQTGKGSTQPTPPRTSTSTPPIAERNDTVAVDTLIGKRIRVRKITDGDTLEAQLDNGTVERIRLFGLNTPELNPKPGVPRDTFTPQAFAKEARDLLEAMCPPGKDAQIVEKGRDKYGRLLALVFSIDGRDVNRALISAGLARSYFVLESKKDALRKPYEELENDARTARRGLWSLPQNQKK
jgi:micrococcal nuclease